MRNRILSLGAERVAGRLGFVIAAVAVAAIVAACGDEGGGEVGGAPPGRDGSALYAEHCASCHGTDLRGTDLGPSHRSVVYEPGHHPDDAFRSAVANGVRAHHWSFGDMPPVPGLSPAEVDAIIEHVRETQRAEGYEPYPPT